MKVLVQDNGYPAFPFSFIYLPEPPYDTGKDGGATEPVLCCASFGAEVLMISSSRLSSRVAAFGAVEVGCSPVADSVWGGECSVWFESFSAASGFARFWAAEVGCPVRVVVCFAGSGRWRAVVPCFPPEWAFRRLG